MVFRLVDRDLFVSLLATFGLTIVLQQVMNQVFGADLRTANADLGSTFLLGDSVVLGNVKLVAFAVALIAAALLVLFLRRSRTGRAIRATAQNARAARLVGVRTDRVYALAFALNAALCGVAGALVAMVWVIHPFIGITYTVRSFMIVVVAGLGNVASVAAAAAALGVAENFAGFSLGVEFPDGVRVLAAGGDPGRAQLPAQPPAAGAAMNLRGIGPVVLLAAGIAGPFVAPQYSVADRGAVGAGDPGADLGHRRRPDGVQLVRQRGCSSAPGCTPAP